MAQELCWPLNADAAQCLYASIVADTGSFRYSSTTASTHRVVADLIEAGASPWKTATALFESYPLARQLLLGKVLQTLRLTSNGRFASLYTTKAILESCGATKADLDGMVNAGRSIAGVEMSVLVREDSEKSFRVSMRSKGRVNVGELASRFGGGGHVNAAGCSIEADDVEQARDKMEQVAADFFAEIEKR